MLLALSSCGTGDEEQAVSDLQLVGVDFELNSIILTNGGTDDLTTRDIWIYQDGEAFMLDIFRIEPRDVILFSVRELGLLDPSGGEIAVYEGSDFDDETTMLDYVAWGSGGHDRLETASEGGEWPQEGTVDVEVGTIVLLRPDPLFNGPDAWEQSAVIP